MIEIREGNLLEQDDIDIIAHQVNMQGVMNSGIAKQIRLKFPENFNAYRDRCIHAQNKSELLGGTVLIWDSGDKPFIANLFSQEFYGYDGTKFTDYQYFDKCIQAVYNYASSCNLTVGLPYKIGCCRGGGDWDTVLGIIESYFKDSEIRCIICKFDGEKTDNLQEN